ncbi:MAG: hypothetical protein F6K18_33045 [Okeania sp. SIO2C2]|uniref:hypothetical protein n=1 Tax=Okeania sp. SIO2C2 TaxID=2607787 RepID=UPI0013BB1841|nr:hypothetical protein [Okeania sp. SIO2C2]NEP91245.1 hypothetical protein [Okeania sp. SIO2C2]
MKQRRGNVFPTVPCSLLYNLYHVRLNTYTLEQVRQRELEAGGRREEKVRREKVFLSRYYPDMILCQINKCLLQIARIFLRSQPTPNPSQPTPNPSGGGEVRSQESYGNGFNTIFQV